MHCRSVFGDTKVSVCFVIIHLSLLGIAMSQPVQIDFACDGQIESCGELLLPPPLRHEGRLRSDSAALKAADLYTDLALTLHNASHLHRTLGRMDNSIPRLALR